MQKYTLKLNEKTKAEADTKVKALTTLAKKLTAPELQKLADVVANDHVKTALAKKYLGL